MKAAAAILVVGLAAAAGCTADVAETEPMTDRTIALADSVDRLLDTLGTHMSEALAADTVAETRILEYRQYNAASAQLIWINRWIDRIADCVDDEGMIPDVRTLRDLADDAAYTSDAHLLSVLWGAEGGDPGGVAPEVELDYQIAMTGQMGELRSQPFYDEDVAASYSCPVLPDYLTDVSQL